MATRSWVAFLTLTSVLWMRLFGLRPEADDPYAFAALVAATLVVGCAPATRAEKGDAEKGDAE